MRILFLYCCMLFSLSSWAQNVQEKTALESKTNSKELNKIIERLKKSQFRTYAEARLFAQKNNWKLMDSSADNIKIFSGRSPSGRPFYTTTLDRKGNRTFLASKLFQNYGLGLNIQGQGFLVGIWESSLDTFTFPCYVRTTHSFFQTSNGSRVSFPNIATEPIYSFSSLSSHATGVMGTILSKIDAHTDSIDQGTAPLASGLSFSDYDFLPELATYAQAPTNLMFANHSWGTDSIYADYVQALDDILHNAPYLFNVYANGNAWFNTFGLSKNSMSTGASKAVANYQHAYDVRAENPYNSNAANNNIPITDNNLSVSQITIPANSFTLSDNISFEFMINIEHSRVGDLGIYLVGPNNCGTLELSTQNGGTGQNYDSVQLSSNGVTSIANGNFPFKDLLYKTEGDRTLAPINLTGLYASFPLSPLNACPLAGTWSLYVGDDVAGNTGTIKNWTLFVQTLFPTPDFRIKPDLVSTSVVTGPGANSDVFRGPGSGTSFSAPSITGSGILLQQLYKDYHPNFMQSATLKALLIHTTKEAGVEGPEFKFGYGLADVEQAAKVIMNDNISTNILEENLSNGNSFTINLTAGTKPIKATLAWNDPIKPNAITPLDSVSLTNNLDIRIIGPNGTVYPWAMDTTGLHIWDAALRMDNNKDNVEKIEIDNPMFGANYQIIVNHKGNLVGGNQDFSLILSGFLNCANEVADTLLLSDSVKTDQVYFKYANQKIRSNNHIEDSAHTKLVSAGQIVLEPGFVASQNAFTDIFIGDCQQASFARPHGYQPIEREVIVFDKEGKEIGPSDLLNQKSEIAVYPNPTNNVLFIENNDSQTVQYQLLNEIGEVLYNGSLKDFEKTTLHLSHLASGVYFIHLKSKDKIETRKIIKQ